MMISGARRQGVSSPPYRPPASPRALRGGRDFLAAGIALALAGFLLGTEFEAVLEMARLIITIITGGESWAR